MSLISRTIANLISGVSQQPEALRLASQAELQENFHPSVVEGLKKRPPTHHIAKLASGNLGDAFIHTISRDASDRYIVIVTDGNLQIFDTDGNEFTGASLTFPDGKGYLDNSSPSTGIKAITIADKTFIVNTSKATAMDAALSADRGVESLVLIKQGNYSTTYKIIIEGTEFEVPTPKATDSGASDAVKTSQIATDLKAKLDHVTTGLIATSVGTFTDWNVVIEHSTLHIYRTSGEDFEIKTHDTFSDQAMTLAKGTIQKFSRLPTVAPEGFTVEVTGDESSKFDNYFVKFVPTNTSATFDKGVWEECVAPGIPYKFDTSTMPHVLLRNPDGTFTFKAVEWGERTCGDIDSVPNPSFVGHTLQDVFFFKNRLGVISNENTILGRSGEYYAFFPETITTLLDSGPIDTPAGHTQVSTLRHAVAFNEQTLIFSDQAQFALTGGDILTSETCSLKNTTTFDSTLKARPVGAGRNLFFGVGSGGFAGVREYYVMPDSDTKDAADITAHVPMYLKGEIIGLTAATNENVLCAITDDADEPNVAYIYNYYWSGREKLQSAWSKFVFDSDTTVVSAAFLNADLYLIMQRSDGVYLERLSFTPGQVDSDAAFVTHLDRRIDEAGCTSANYSSGTGLTTWTLPYSAVGDITVVTRAAGGGETPGTVLDTTTNGTIITAEGNYASIPVYIGQPYTARYRFSKLMLRETASGSGQVPVSGGRLQIRKMSLTYSNTGLFRVEVTPLYRDTYTYTHTGLTLGSGSAQVGAPAIDSGIFPFPVMCNNEEAQVEVVSDSFLPCKLLSASWEAMYNNRFRGR